MGKHAHDLASLRQRAETKLRGKPLKPSVIAPEDSARLVHELGIHQAELEMQNDELQRAQQELEEMRDRYFSLYDLAPIAYFALDRAGKIVEANTTAATLLGVPRGELANVPLQAFMDQEDADEFHRLRMRVLATRAKQGADLCLRRKDNARIFAHVDAVAPVDAAGVASGMRCVVIDVSELRRTQEGLRAQEAKSRTFLDTTSDAVLLATADGTIEAVNVAAQDLLGVDAHRLVGRHLDSILPLPPEGASRAAGEIEVHRADGSIFPASLGVGRWVDHGEQKLAAILHDLSEHRATLTRLRESEERFREIAETVEDVFYVREESGRLAYVNPACIDVLGVPPETLQTGTISLNDLVHEGDRERVAESRAQMERGDPLDHEFRLVRPDGETRHIRERAFPVYDEDGAIARQVGVMQDLTFERELQQELHHAQKMEALGALASGVAHDFNNVLHVVLGFTTMALKETDETRRGDHLRHALSTTKRGADLANRLMAFARKQGIALKPIEIDAAIKDARKLIGCLLTETISVEIDLRAPGCSVLAGTVPIEQILMNLATNARDAMPNGGTFRIETTEVAIDATEARQLGLPSAGDHVRIVVRDTGVGMTAATRKRALEAFFTTKPAGKGTGLGLATVSSVVKQLRGALEVESSPGRGASFTVFLPLCATAQPKYSEAISEDDRWHARALLVEDDPSVRTTVRRYLEELGLDVVEAADVADARRLHAQHEGELELFVTDVVMPRMSGPELVASLDESLPTLFISALPEGSDALPALGTRQAMLRKPFDRSALAGKLDVILERGLRYRARAPREG